MQWASWAGNLAFTLYAFSLTYQDVQASEQRATLNGGVAGGQTPHRWGEPAVRPMPRCLPLNGMTLPRRFQEGPPATLPYPRTI